jgi:hypothetical protein
LPSNRPPQRAQRHTRHLIRCQRLARLHRTAAKLKRQPQPLQLQLPSHHTINDTCATQAHSRNAHFAQGDAKVEVEQRARTRQLVLLLSPNRPAAPYVLGTVSTRSADGDTLDRCHRVGARHWVLSCPHHACPWAVHCKGTNRDKRCCNNPLCLSGYVPCHPSVKTPITNQSPTNLHQAHSTCKSISCAMADQHHVEGMLSAYQAPLHQRPHVHFQLPHQAAIVEGWDAALPALPQHVLYLRDSVANHTMKQPICCLAIKPQPLRWLTAAAAAAASEALPVTALTSPSTVATQVLCCHSQISLIWTDRMTSLTFGTWSRPLLNAMHSAGCRHPKHMRMHHTDEHSSSIHRWHDGCFS